MCSSDLPWRSPIILSKLSTETSIPWRSHIILSKLSTEKPIPWRNPTFLPNLSTEKPIPWRNPIILPKLATKTTAPSQKTYFKKLKLSAQDHTPSNEAETGPKELHMRLFSTLHNSMLRHKQSIVSEI